MCKGNLTADQCDPIGVDRTTMGGGYRTRVDFGVAMEIEASNTRHPVDDLEPLDDGQADKLRAAMLAFVAQFANMTMEHRHVVCLRAMGYTWNTIRVEMRHASRQASHNLFKDALRANPRVARMFNNKTKG